MCFDLLNVTNKSLPFKNITEVFFAVKRREGEKEGRREERRNSGRKHGDIRQHGEGV